MSRLTVLFGGFWGSEGKGQIAREITARESIRTDPLVGVRVGGPNAGHTIFDARGIMRKVQQIPVIAFVRRDAVAVIGASGLILPEVLERELRWLDETWGDGPGAPTVMVDYQATVITPHHMAAEAGIKTRIASTGEGVGAATADKVMRQAQTFESWMHEIRSGKVTASYEISRRAEYIGSRVELDDTVDYLNYLADEDRHRAAHNPHILIEGTQGYLLSLNTSRYYPYTTSRDCGPEAIMGQVGLSFRSFEKQEIIAVMRTYPIRVGGTSGPMGRELNWDEMGRRTNGYVKTPEITTVTGKQRRIAEWDPEIALQVVRETRPTGIALTFLDYVVPESSRSRHENQLPHAAVAHIQSVEEQLGVPVVWVSTALGTSFPYTQHAEVGVIE